MAFLKKQVAALALWMGATGLVHASGWTAELTVTSVFTEATTDLIIIYTASGGAYAPGCAANAWVFPANTTARASRGYATLMSAVATGKRIKLWFSDTCGVWGYHEATTIMIVN